MNKPLLAFFLLPMIVLPLVSPRADMFVLESGEPIEGTVAEGTDMALFIRMMNNALQPVMIADIKEVRLKLSNGQEIVGRLTGFKEGSYEVAVDDWQLTIKDGLIQKSKKSQPGLPPIGNGIGGPAVEPEAVTPEEALIKKAPL